MTAITIGKIRILLEQGNGKQKSVVAEANVGNFTDSLVKDQDKTLRLSKTFALLGCRGDKLYIQYYNATEQIDVSAGGAGFIEIQDYTNVTERAQLGYFGAKYSPFGGVAIKPSVAELRSVQLDKWDSDMMGDPDSRQTDATVDTVVSEWSTFSTITPNSDGVLLVRAGSFWEFDKSSFTELA